MVSFLAPAIVVRVSQTGVGLILMTKHSTCVALLLAVTFLAAACGQEPVRIGFSGQLVGEYADLGVAGRNGAMLAVEDLNSRGGIAGRPVELLVRDDGNLPETALQGDLELLQAGVAGIVGHMTSSQTMAVLPELRERGVPLVSPTTSTPLLSGIKDAFFRVQVASDYNAEGLALFCRERLGLQRVVLLQDSGNKAYIRSFVEAFSKALQNVGGSVAGVVEFDASGLPDWQALLKSALEHQPQALCIVAPASATAMLAQHARLLRLDLPLLSSGLARTATLLEQGGKSVEGMYMTNSINAESESFHEFARRYDARFGKKALFASVRGYEAAMLLAAGLERTGGSAEGLVQALQQVESVPGIDSEVRLDEFGDAQRPSFILEVRQGAFVNVAEIAPRGAR